jgi:hypothetical protein
MADYVPMSFRNVEPIEGWETKIISAQSHGSLYGVSKQVPVFSMFDHIEESSSLYPVYCTIPLPHNTSSIQDNIRPQHNT